MRLNETGLDAISVPYLGIEQVPLGKRLRVAGAILYGVLSEPLRKTLCCAYTFLSHCPFCMCSQMSNGRFLRKC